MQLYLLSTYFAITHRNNNLLTSIFQVNQEMNLKSYDRTESNYNYVDSQIAKSLNYDPLKNNKKLVRLMPNHDTIFLDGVIKSNFQFDLKSLKTLFENVKKTHETDAATSLEVTSIIACTCERKIFNDENSFNSLSSLPRHISALISLNKNEETFEYDSLQLVTTSQLAVTILESEIRCIIKKEAGHAPLLKEMIEHLATTLAENVTDSEYLVEILRTLLLPTGLNLRNLLWHGFLSNLHRRWFSLLFVLIVSLHKFSLKNLTVPESDSTDLIHDLKSHKSFVELIGHGNRIKSSSDNIRLLEDYAQSFVPVSYHKILHVALHNYLCHSNACFIAIVIPILEQCLRLLFCQVNNRLDDQIARMGAYYVTLDGHGQRDKHDMILAPYISASAESSSASSTSSSDIVENKLIAKIGASTTAILTDLFASPASCGGPNIRAAITHGSWDSFLQSELQSNINNTSSSELHDVTCVLVSILYILSRTNEAEANLVFPKLTIANSYQPIFSFSSFTHRNMDSLLNHITTLDDFLNTHEFILQTAHQTASNYPNIQQLHTPFGLLQDLKNDIFGKLYTSNNNSWSTSQLFQEYKMNVELSHCGAARTLVKDISNGIDVYNKLLFQLYQGYSKGQCNSRQKKKFMNLASIAIILIDFYSFCFFVALYSMAQDSKNTLKAVERVRMVVSTVSTFSLVNVNRAINSAIILTKSKAVKEFLMYREMMIMKNN